MNLPGPKIAAPNLFCIDNKNGGRASGTLPIFSQFFWFLVLFLCLGGCVSTAPVLEMAMTDATFRYAKDRGVDVQQPESFNLAKELYTKARYYLRQRQFGDAKSYAIEARQVLERAELALLKGEKVSDVVAPPREQGTPAEVSDEELFGEEEL